MTIDGYLADLRRRLPLYRRRRVVTEVEGHLRESAARHRAEGAEPEAAEKAAVAAFGTANVVARRLRSELAVGETRVASALALVAAGAFVVPLYLIPENTLPPAAWVEKPRDIAVLQLVAVALWAAAGGLAAAASVLSWTRASRFVAPALELALRALAGSLLVSAVLVVRWFTAAPNTLSWPLLAAPVAVVCLWACAEAAGWAHSRRCLLVRD